MDMVLRSASVYVALLILFRIAGKRALAQITTFDLVLLLIISEAIQNALVMDDHSITNALIIVITLLGADLGLAMLTQRYRWVDKLVDDVPLVLVVDGHPIPDRLRRARVSETDILDAARESRGVGAMSQIRFAILERTGGISIILNSPNPESTHARASDHPDIA